MQGNQLGFESSFRQHLDTEQRRAVLEAIGANIHPDSTLGEVLDAAQALGWSEQMADLSLADLADALLAPEADDVEEAAAEEEAEDEAAEEDAEAEEDEYEEDEYEDDEYEDDEYEEDEAEDEDEDEEDEEEDEVAAPRRGRRRAAANKATKKTAKKTSKKPAKKTSKKTSKKPAKKTSKKPAKKTSKKPAKKTSKKPAKKTSKSSRGRRRPAVDVDERMSLEQAAEFFVGYVEELGEATMQALEEETGIGRRKLRFHIGQLVKEGYLERHGMGRGTYYTVV